MQLNKGKQCYFCQDGWKVKVEIDRTIINSIGERIISFHCIEDGLLKDCDGFGTPVEFQEIRA